MARNTNGTADAAQMTNTIVVMQTNNLNQAITLNSLYVKGGGSGKGYVIAPNSGSLIFDGTAPTITNYKTPVTISAPITLNTDLTVAVDTGGQSGNSVFSLSISGIISGSGGLIKESSGLLYMKAVNTYLGNTKVRAVSANNDANGIYLYFISGTRPANVLPVGTVLTVDGDLAKPGIVSFRKESGGSATFSQTVAGLTGAGLLSSDAVGCSYYLTVNNTNDCTFSGMIQNALGLIKTNTGVFVLSGSNTYTLGTTVNGGTLLVNNATGSGAGSGTVTVNNGGTLGGTGTVNGAVTVNTGGTFSPGNPVGTFTAASNNVTLASNTTFRVTLNGTNTTQYGQLLVASTNSTVALTNSVLGVVLGFAPKSGDVFTIVNNSGTNAVKGQFACGTQDFLVGTAGVRFAVNYAGGDGNDVFLICTTPSRGTIIAIK